jgi:hypothetical protein
LWLIDPFLTLRLIPLDGVFQSFYLLFFVAFGELADPGDPVGKVMS